ncbi:hypothetical protein HPP92_023967 [Vanilla planifolia]|uniref:Uncharacterized protein n=1 Tax=Vanilla planifolia TaxID=51239 RepID=A0A835UB40_VANPL|nr:hypothetical protein HPP92_023967 [Vanilla planifolia]
MLISDLGEVGYLGIGFSHLLRPMRDAKACVTDQLRQSRKLYKTQEQANQSVKKDK